MRVVATEIPRVVPSFNVNSEVFKTSAYAAYTKMHNTRFAEYLTIELPSFNDELEIILNENSYGIELQPFVKSSELLYDYVFAGVDFSKVKVIRFFQLSLFNYFYTIFLPDLEELIFDHSLYNNASSEHEFIEITEFLESTLDRNKLKKLIVRIDENAKSFFDEDEIKNVKSKYVDRVTIIHY